MSLEANSWEELENFIQDQETTRKINEKARIEGYNAWIEKLSNLASGNWSLNYRGQWTLGTIYYPNDVVLYVTTKEVDEEEEVVVTVVDEEGKVVYDVSWVTKDDALHSGTWTTKERLSLDDIDKGTHLDAQGRDCEFVEQTKTSLTGQVMTPETFAALFPNRTSANVPFTETLTSTEKDALDNESLIEKEYFVHTVVTDQGLTSGYQYDLKETKTNYFAYKLLTQQTTTKTITNKKTVNNTSAYACCKQTTERPLILQDDGSEELSKCWVPLDGGVSSMGDELEAMRLLLEGEFEAADSEILNKLSEATKDFAPLSMLNPLAIEYGGTGNKTGTSASCAGNSATASKLLTPRTIRTNLSSLDYASFDGSENVTPGITGTLAIGNGGTGLSQNPSMLVNLGSTSADTVLKASPRPGITGVLGISNGGTGQKTLAAAQTALGIQTSCISVYKSGNTELTCGTSWTKVSMDTVAYKRGSDLSLSNGGIKCAKAGYVLILCSGRLSDVYNSTTLARVRLTHNSSSRKECIVPAVSDEPGFSLFAFEKIVSVAAGDMFYIHCAGEGNYCYWLCDGSNTFAAMYI